MCSWGTDKLICVLHRNNDLFPDGWHPMGVDACIADYVQVMNCLDIVTVGCCCGHGQAPGVVLVDVKSIPLLERYGYKYHIFEPGRTDVVEHHIDNVWDEPTD